MSTSITHSDRRSLNGSLSSLRTGEEEPWLEVVRKQAAALKFGSVSITVHEGRVVQIETSAKLRFDKP